MDLDNIIKGCARGNRKDQERLYNLYRNALFALSLKYCRNDAEAEDNLHNTFLDIFSNISTFKASGSFEGWIKRITINKAINTYKKSFELTPIKDDYPQEITQDDYLDLSLDYLLSLIQELPNQYRLVFCLYELDDYSHQEIAAMLSISEGTSKSNLHRAKLLLREKIKTRDLYQNHNARHGK